MATPLRGPERYKPGRVRYHNDMSPALAHEPIPLQLDADRVFRVGGTRVPLETVVSLFEQGETPEEIAQKFPVLRLDDVYAVATYYLRHREEIASYLERRGVEARLRQEELARLPGANQLRQRLRDLRSETQPEKRLSLKELLLTDQVGPTFRCRHGDVKRHVSTIQCRGGPLWPPLVKGLQRSRRQTC